MSGTCTLYVNSGTCIRTVNDLHAHTCICFLQVENVDANSLTASAHSVVFTLMAHLRQTLTNQFNESEQSRSLAPLSSGPLQSILRGLLNNLLRCPSGKSVYSVVCIGLMVTTVLTIRRVY